MRHAPVARLKATAPMPLYDYDCAACGRRVEVVHGVHAPGPAHCPNCGGGPLKKAITAPAVHFKGSGWAKRDRRATVAAGSSKTSTESGSTGDGDKGGDKDGGTATASASDGGGTRSSDDSGERAAASPKSTGAATATKTD
jgi:putative FmdB family regulatory protein